MTNKSTFIAILFLSASFMATYISPASGDVLMKADEALKKIYKNAVQFDPQTIQLSEEQKDIIEEKIGINFTTSHSDTIQLYTARDNAQIIGYAFEDIVHGKWGPIHYLIGLDTGGSVLEVIVLDYQEIRGRPVAKKRFLRQYKGKSSEDPVKLRKDIDGVTGATISSRSMTDGVRKLLFVFTTLKLGAEQ